MSPQTFRRSRTRRVHHAARSLLTQDSSLLGVFVRFVVAGGLNTILYMLVTLFAADVAGLPFQGALMIGFATAVIVSFLAQRRFVWARRGQYHLAIHHQAGRFLLWVVAQYGVTVVATLSLPSALGIPTDVVYVATMTTFGVINFLVMRYAIFHSQQLQREASSTKELFHSRQLHGEASTDEPQLDCARDAR